MNELPVSTPSRGSRVRRLPAAAIASAALIVPAVSGMLFGPQRPRTLAWYRSLRMPDYKPPDAAIPVAWTIIDSALAYAGYRLLRKPGSAQRNRSLGWLATNVGLIGGWNAIFFGRRNLPASLAAATTMIGTGAAYVAESRRVDPKAATAGVPFLAWVGFATVLTASIWNRNRGH